MAKQKTPQHNQQQDKPQNQTRRNTKTKQLVMAVLENSKSALCHEEIEKLLPEKIDRVTIYRILQGFCDDGKVHKIINNDGRTYYALCNHCNEGHHNDNHPHFHCVTCDTITCMEQPVAMQKLPSGYKAVSTAAYISGYCKKCSGILKTVLLAGIVFTGQMIGIAQTAASAQVTQAAQTTKPVQSTQKSHTKIQILDKETNTPISFAGIYYPDTKTGTASDSAGQFTIDFAMPQ
ncbi:MAG: transcriptional repressor, partial [Bacteroidales bacterium]|nr:transcriptional repressor [Bacteroidales bacterium]